MVQEAKDAGVFVFAGGLEDPGEESVVATDGTVTDGPHPETKDFLGGFTVVDVLTREAALEWAASWRLPATVPKRFASSCQTLPSEADKRL